MEGVHGPANWSETCQTHIAQLELLLRGRFQGDPGTQGDRLSSLGFAKPHHYHLTSTCSVFRWFLPVLRCGDCVDCVETITWVHFARFLQTSTSSDGLKQKYTLEVSVEVKTIMHH